MDHRIVVVDDDLAYLQLVEAFAASSLIGVAVFERWSDDVRQELRESDLLMLDIHMPGIDGLDVLMELGKSGFLGGVVLMSGSDPSILDSIRSMAQKLDLNFAGTLSKPFRLASFNNLASSYFKRPTRNYNRSDSNAVIAREDLDRILKQELYFPVYQPQVDAVSDSIVGMECLTRVDDPVLGWVSPFDFILALSENGMVSQYTFALIKNSLAELITLFDEFPNITVSYNIDARSLNREFALNMIDLIQNSGIALSRVTLEITEANAMSLSSDELYAINKFRAVGLMLSLDDYGTGYSSIQVLHELPISELKIDRSFIQNIHDNVKSREIIRSLGRLSESLNYRLVGEGVENKRQIEALTQLGCSIFQGYFFAEPLKIKDLKTYLMERHSDQS